MGLGSGDGAAMQIGVICTRFGGSGSNLVWRCGHDCPACRVKPVLVQPGRWLMAGGASAGLPVGWAWRLLSDDQPRGTSTVRASPAMGPDGSANPIQKANSAGNSASTVPALPQQPPRRELGHADQ